VRLARAGVATVRLPEFLARFHQRFTHLVEVAQVTLVRGHALAAQRVHLVAAAVRGMVVDEVVRHGVTVDPRPGDFFLS
jgi:hypothetical protein